ncbi:unnamed protein product [Candida verbasci]|uniref:SH3 domain-containing protein n=1 Tax=Candida verbasci TaxID=1227364 RepID=A0A9W4TUK2_9ASCO|nr:unnamed protein product [Candida verbasci]
MTEPNPPFKVKAIYDYKSDYEDDLPFETGQIITVIEIENEEWYSGEIDGKSGMFPKNFVEIYHPIVPTANRPVRKTHTQPTQQEPQPTIGKEESKQEQPHGHESESSKPTETVAEPKKEHSELKKEHTATGKVPLPQSYHKEKDPYAVKKQFVAASTSSYVPPVKPRDDPYSVAHPVHDVAKNEPKPAYIEKEENKHVEDDQPKLSLKERIALIQKQQQEEAEREAAAIKRKEERKKKQADEKERLRNQKSGENELTSIKSNELVETIPEEHHHHQPTEKRKSHSEPSAVAIPGMAIPQSNFQKEDEDDDDLRREIERDDHGTENEADEEPEQEEEEEEDDEELKRRRLVERMAKISGGRNMFGMMGIPGQIPSTGSTKITKKSTESPKTSPIATKAPPIPVSRESSSMVEDDEPSESEPNPEVITQSDINKQQQEEEPVHHRHREKEAPPAPPDHHHTHTHSKTKEAPPPPPQIPPVPTSPTNQRAAPQLPTSQPASTIPIPTSVSNYKGDEADEEDETETFEFVDTPQIASVSYHHPRAPPPPIPIQDESEEEEQAPKLPTRIHNKQQQPQSHPRGAPPPIPAGAPPIPIGIPPTRAQTDIHNVVLDPSLTRKKSLQENRSSDQFLNELKIQAKNGLFSTDWYLEENLPEFATRFNLEYEVEKNSIVKKNGRVVDYLDYYINFGDEDSTAILELAYDDSNPNETIKLVNYYVEYK